MARRSSLAAGKGRVKAYRGPCKVRGRSITRDLTSGVKPTGNWEIVNLGFLLIKSA